jgi:para-aminobenzoate synthetase
LVVSDYGGFTAVVQTLLIDNFDSFTYNLAELVTAVNGIPPIVVTNDVSWEELDFAAMDNVVVSPGPGSPTVRQDFGICGRVMAESGLPVLGVCLGHQGLCAAFGARVVRAPDPVHGRLSTIRHVGRDLFAGIPSPMSVVRYHSLIVEDVPGELEVLARTADGLVMAVRHRERPLWGVQFHPESIAGEHGASIMANFRDLSLAAAGSRRATRAPAPAALATRPQPASYVVEHRHIEYHPDPDRLYRRLFAGRRGAFWLDGSAAVDPGARFSVMGDATGPLSEYLTYDVGTKVVRIEGEDSVEEQCVPSIFDYLECKLRERAVPADPALPFDFHLGFVGYLGYELKAETGGSRAHRSPYPDAALVFAARAVVIDHDRRCSHLLVLSPSPDDPHSREWLDRTAAALSSVGPAPDRCTAPSVLTNPGDGPLDLRLDAGTYRARIRESLELIRAGQTYEVCLTNIARVNHGVDALATFDRVRMLNPVPHAALLQFTGLSVISASPERLVRLNRDGSLESRPIKGTRPRGASPAQDLALRTALAGSEKDRAENLMIVDLVRNDVARVCASGSVHVSELFGIESYASVHQMVSTVRGCLRRDAHPVDAVRALFPAGSMTGAPKLRTMSILDRLESGPRGVYSGALGYLSLSGAVDLSVVIRTMVATAGAVEFGIGGAITALSDPIDEYAEILVKAASSQRVLAEAAEQRHPGSAADGFRLVPRDRQFTMRTA